MCVCTYACAVFAAGRWYQSWDTAEEGSVMTGAFLPQIWPAAVLGERQKALESIGEGMTRSAFFKMIYEFAIWKPSHCKLPQMLGLATKDHEYHKIDLTKLGEK